MSSSTPPTPPRERATGESATPAETTSGTRRRGARDLLVVVAGLAIGFLLVVLVRGVLGGDATSGGDVAGDGAMADDVASAPEDGGDTEPAPGDGAGGATVAPGDGIDGEPVPADAASEPIDALEGFLVREVERDFEASFAYLSVSERDQFGTEAQWAAAHRQLLPIRGFRVLDDTLAMDGDLATVDALVASDGVLDPVVGLVPAVSRSSWVLEPVEGTWRVVYSAATFEAALPDVEGAEDAAQAWVGAAVACEEPPSGLSRLLGSPGLVDDLCAAEGEVAVGEVGLLAPSGDAFGLVAAFGPESLGWARVVPVDEPLALDLALAPLADGWAVVGALPR